jgi:hypothetical protein
MLVMAILYINNQFIALEVGITEGDQHNLARRSASELYRCARANCCCFNEFGSCAVREAFRH